MIGFCRTTKGWLNWWKTSNRSQAMHAKWQTVDPCNIFSLLHSAGFHLILFTPFLILYFFLFLCFSFLATFQIQSATKIAPLIRYVWVMTRDKLLTHQLIITFFYYPSRKTAILCLSNISCEYLKYLWSSRGQRSIQVKKG